ncbi:beta-galactoside-binding lectin-like [Pholidichthys leucotaenia]
MSFRSGQTMTITGVFDADPKEYVVDISPADPCACGDIALRVDIRFHAKGNQNVIVLNSRQGGKWSQPAEVNGFPFKAGKPFKVKIQFTPTNFEVTFNDNTKGFLHHSLDETRYKTLTFNGDGSVSSININ